MPRDPRQWDLTKGASKLNEYREEVIGLFREGFALAKIGKRYGMVATGVRRWLKTQGEYERTIECELLGCSKSFSFRPRKRYCSRLHVRRANARARSNRPEEKIKNAARRKLHKAVYEGQVVRPLTCERCGDRRGFAKDGRSLIQADHHRGYDTEYALDVWWICKSCDDQVEKLRRIGKTVNREHPRAGPDSLT